ESINDSGLSVLVDVGGGFRPFSEATGSTPDLVEGPNPLDPGKPRKRAFVLGVAGGWFDVGQLQMAFAFPKPGRYRIVADYIGLVRSNEVTVDVSSPKGADAELFSKYIQHHP